MGCTSLFPLVLTVVGNEAVLKAGQRTAEHSFFSGAGREQYDSRASTKGRSHCPPASLSRPHGTFSAS